VTDGGSPDDADLAAYVEAIEAHFRARRGKDQALSPRDFALAKGFHQAGIPLGAVLLGIDRSFEADPNTSSLAFCRRRIEDLGASGPRGSAEPGGTERLAAPEVLEVLTLLQERLQGLPPRVRASFELPLRRIAEVMDLVTVAARPNWAYVREKLREIDDEVSAAVVAALPAEDAARIRAEAAKAAERHRGRVDETALADAAARLTVQRARETLELPRVSLG
jgi:hypothetical protein